MNTCDWKYFENTSLIFLFQEVSNWLVELPVSTAILDVCTEMADQGYWRATVYFRDPQRRNNPPRVDNAGHRE